MVWVEVSDEADLAQWACDCAHNGPLACAHVAATLSAWIAHPTDFAIIGAEAPGDAEPESTRTLPPPTASLAPPTQTSPGARDCSFRGFDDACLSPGPHERCGC